MVPFSKKYFCTIKRPIEESNCERIKHSLYTFTNLYLVKTKPYYIIKANKTHSKILEYHKKIHAVPSPSYFRRTVLFEILMGSVLVV
jgi:hypothetical protein